MENQADLFEIRQDLHQVSLELFALSRVVTDFQNADETVREGLGFLIENVSQRISSISNALPAE